MITMAHPAIVDSIDLIVNRINTINFGMASLVSNSAPSHVC